jgi:hypothetical protein
MKKKFVPFVLSSGHISSVGMSKKSNTFYTSVTNYISLPCHSTSSFITACKSDERSLKDFNEK